MKRLFLSLALGFTPVYVQGADDVIRIYHRFQQPPPAAVLSSMEEELSVIMRPVGVELEWRSFAAAAGREVSVELVIVTFEGGCDVGNFRPGDDNAGTLGSTNITDGAVLPYITVRCEAVRRFVMRDLFGLPAESRETAYGRALARVLAHEMYHVFSKSTEHDSSGLVKPRFSVRDLLSDRPEFNERQRALLRAYGDYLTGRASSPAAYAATHSAMR